MADWISRLPQLIKLLFVGMMQRLLAFMFALAMASAARGGSPCVRQDGLRADPGAQYTVDLGFNISNQNKTGIHGFHAALSCTLALAVATSRAYSASPVPVQTDDLFNTPIGTVEASPTPSPSPAPTQAAAAAPAPPSVPKPVYNSEQRQEYQDAIDKAEEGKKGNEYSAGIWGVTTLLCGYNCFQYMVTLSAAQAKLSAALTKASTSVGVLQGCPGGGTAAAAPLAAAVSSCIGLLGADGASKAVAATGFTPVALAVLPGAMAAGSAAENSHKACQTSLKATQTSAVTAANAQGTTYAAAVYTSALAGPCYTAATTIGTDIGTVGTAEAAYWALSAQIITTGYFCAGAAVASAAADLAISSNMAGDVSEGMMGAIGAAPAVIGTVVTLATSAGGYVSHNASGITSCVTAALGGVVTANKIVTSQDYQNSIDKNTASRDELAHLNPSMMTPKMWMRFFASAGDTVGSLFGSCAFAAVRVSGSGVEAFKLAEACKQSSVTRTTRLSCARSSDTALEKMHQQDPSHLSGLLENFEETFGRAALQQVLARPFDPGYMASLIAREDPSRVPQLTQFFASLPAKVTGKALKTSVPPNPVLGVAKLSETTIASALSSESQHPSDRSPASAQAGEPEEVATGPTSLFEIVSKRYRSVQDRVEKRPYSLPYNRFSTSN